MCHNTIIMKKVFAEIGIGNKTFLSTEIEEGLGESRIPQFILPKKIEGYYLRFWVFRRVIIFSTNEGVKLQKKTGNHFKILFGISGISE